MDMMDRVAECEQQWIDPVTDDQGITAFRLYPQPSRGEPGAQGSYQLYLPPGYDEQEDRRFPVIYWLHGGFGDSRQSRPAIERIDKAIASGTMPQTIVVSPQALPIGWYLDSKDGARPVEQVMVRDLVQHVDATYRTVAAPGGRFIEGFSMGGYGALHLGLKYPSLFGRISAIGPAILRDMSLEPEERIANTFFGDHDYYRAVHPETLLLANAPQLRKFTRVRLLLGAGDLRLASAVREFAAQMEDLGVPYEFYEVEGAAHDIAETIDGLDDTYYAFWRD
jgi:enterochelin esterase-like enzyme